MPVDLQQFVRDTKKQILAESTIEEHLEGLTLEQVLPGLSDLSDEQRQDILRILHQKKTADS